MIEQLSQLSLILLISLTGILTYTGWVLLSEEEALKNFSLSQIAMTATLLLGPIFFDWDIKHLILLAFMLVPILGLLSSKLSSQVHLIVSSILPLILLFVLEGQINTINEFVSFDIVLLVIGIISYGLYYKSNKHPKLNASIGLMAFGLLITFIAPVEYSIIAAAILIAAIIWFMVQIPLQQKQTKMLALESKLKRLEDDFNDEVRKAVNRHTFHLKEVQEKMSHINKIDNLTKAYNKKAIFNIIEDLTMNKKIEEFSIIMFDLDNFKTLNDTLGHVQGDMCLRSLSKIAQDSIRDSDYLGRFGGDEFLMVLPKAKLNTATTIAERFRKNIDEQTKPHFTVSVGLATYPADGKSLKTLLDIADQGLYVSKEKGRNSVSYSNPSLGKKF